jgi:hypothetical protein
VPRVYLVYLSASWVSNEEWAVAKLRKKRGGAIPTGYKIRPRLARVLYLSTAADPGIHNYPGKPEDTRRILRAKVVRGTKPRRYRASRFSTNFKREVMRTASHCGFHNKCAKAGYPEINGFWINPDRDFMKIHDCHVIFEPNLINSWIIHQGIHQSDCVYFLLKVANLQRNPIRAITICDPRLLPSIDLVTSLKKLFRPVA